MPIGNRFKVATVRGIPIYVATSWIWIALIWGFSIYTSLQPAVSSPARAVWLTIFEGTLFFGGILLHEAAHAIAAREARAPGRRASRSCSGAAPPKPRRARRAQSPSS